ncbi:hypothetical protein [Parasitella parasitica]|uniref:Uncharacterized protein n=1 Tax=Parasitella parasitica TaxID=35722 RepID=A0A0B7N713_9FUNG|nr:hypothetical protein [Parasitella parasitica]
MDENQLNEIGNHGEIPVAMLVNYQDVQNAILEKLNAAARKHKSDEKSVVLWLEYLKENGYETVLDISDNTDAPLVLSWYSPWQKKYLKAAEDWFLDSTHKTCVSFIDKRDCYLMTIVVHNPITKKGLLVAFFITSMECSPTIERFLSWLKNNNNLKLKRIMIDCSATEQRAIILSFSSTVQILLCDWHLQRVWEDHIKKISFKGGTADKKAARKLFRARLCKILYSEKEDGFWENWNQFKTFYETDHLTFLTYLYKNWMTKKEKWAKAWRPEAISHTNNYIESYHNQVKSFCLGKSGDCRIDRIVYMLSQVVERNYRQDTLQHYFGLKKVHLYKQDLQHQKLLDAILNEKGLEMINEFEPDDMRPNTVRFWMHIFLVARICKLSFTIKKNVCLSSPLLLELREKGDDLLAYDKVESLEHEQAEDEEKADLFSLNESIEKANTRLQKSIVNARRSASTFEDKEYCFRS